MLGTHQNKISSLAWPYGQADFGRKKNIPKSFKKWAFFRLSGSEKNSKNFENRKKISKHVKSIPNDHINFYKQKKIDVENIENQKVAN